jgi:hypothetical protein
MVNLLHATTMFIARPLSHLHCGGGGAVCVCNSHVVVLCLGLEQDAAKKLLQGVCGRNRVKLNWLKEAQEAKTPSAWAKLVAHISQEPLSADSAWEPSRGWELSPGSEHGALGASARTDAGAKRTSTQRRYSGVVDARSEDLRWDTRGQFTDAGERARSRRATTNSVSAAAGKSDQLASHHGRDTLPVAWRELVAKIGEELAVAMQLLSAELQEVTLLHPNVAPILQASMERVENAKRAAMISHRVAQMRSERLRQQAEILSVRDVSVQVVEQRRAWLQKRDVRARLGLLDAKAYADPSALHTLIDELLAWAGGVAPEVGIAISTTPPHESAKLQIYARVDTSTLKAETWQNAGWYLWHQLAGTMGVKAELGVSEQALCVTVVFPPLPDIETTTVMKELHHDHDAAEIVAGCRVLLISPDTQLMELAVGSISQLQLVVQTSVGLAQVSELLRGMAPHVVVYDGALNPGEVMQLRNDLSALGKVAFVELSRETVADFQIVSLGTMSTAHVALSAIKESLAPALIFELCKVI